MTTNIGYTIDCWRFQLHKMVPGVYPGFFDKYHKIYVAGDHGGHFSNAGLMIEESKFYREYNKEIHLCFFPSYHAHGRADAAGAEDKRSAAADKKDRRMRLGAESYTRMTNGSNDRRSIAFNMIEIRRTLGAYTQKSERSPAAFIRKWNEVSYEYKNRSKATEGVRKYRRHSGQGPWGFFDLLVRPKSTPPICQACSQTADSVVRHNKQTCKLTLTNPAEGLDCNTFSREHVVLENSTQPHHAKSKDQKKKKKGRSTATSYYCHFPGTRTMHPTPFTIASNTHTRTRARPRLALALVCGLVLALVCALARVRSPARASARACARPRLACARPRRACALACARVRTLARARARARAYARACARGRGRAQTPHRITFVLRLQTPSRQA